jgi:hypothetical protein
MVYPKPPNATPEPSAEQLLVITVLAQALGRGSTKLCEALSLTYGELSLKHERARHIDRQLQPFAKELSPLQPDLGREIQ